MLRIFNFIKSFFNEILIIFLLIFIISNYIGNVDKTINADAVGYYDYLPSIFIHHDLVRYKTNQQLSPEKFERINSLDVYLDYKDSKINRYLCGTAILESPFFFFTYFTQEKSQDINDGYQTPYHHAIFYAAVFYLLLTIFFFKKLLQLYKCSRGTIILAQLMLVLGTSVTNYVNFDAGFSHIYSLFAITTFIYLVKKYFENRKFAYYLLACAFLGLIILIRPVNGIIIFFIPFLAGSFGKLKEEFVFLFKNITKTVSGIVLVLAIMAIQSLLWYLQTGNILLNTYQDIGFNFLKPEWVNVLVSYRKGLFVYTPILLFAFPALIWLAVKGRYYEIFTWLALFAIATYVISSWNCWYYGASFGLRAYIDFYSIFFILFALMYDRISRWFKIAFIIPATFLIYLNIVQTYQYKEYILGWGQMDKQKFWTIFLKTDDAYKGLVWKKQYEYSSYMMTDKILVGTFSIPAHTDADIFRMNTSRINNIEDVEFFQVGITNDFSDDNDARILLLIRDIEKDSVVYYHARSLIHFNEKGLNNFHAGLYNFELSQKLPHKKYELILHASSQSGKLELHDIKIKVFRKL